MQVYGTDFQDEVPVILISRTRENKALLGKTNYIRFLGLPIPNYLQNTKEIYFSTTAAKLRFCLIFTGSRS